MVKIRNKETLAVAVNCEDAQSRRIEIKSKEFEMKPINKIISDTPILTEEQIQLGFWISKYYFEPLTYVFKAIAPKPPKKIIKELPVKDEKDPDARTGKILPAAKPLLLRSDSLKLSSDFLRPEIEKILAEGRQILVLAPEINLAKKISALIASGLPDEELADLSNKTSGNKVWQQYIKIRDNQVKIIIATRSGAFAPFSRLGLIIIIDENNPSYKQWEGHPLYDARDIAEKLSELFGAKIIRESKSPSITAYYKAQNGLYEFTALADKNSSAVAPKIIDMRAEHHKGNFSPLSEIFTDKISRIIKEKKRAIFFLNRRGAANFIVCKNCGYIAKCPMCQIPLIYYPEIKTAADTVKYERLICNHCNFSYQPQTTCAKCKGVEIKYMGLGTQKIENLLKRDFPHLNVLRFDSDTVKNSKDSGQILDLFSSKTPSVLITTQQIFSASALPEVSFVGVISLDAMLAIPDFRANERAFAYIVKISAFSNDLAIQTYNPENPALKFLASMNYDALCRKEIEDRRILFYPPFSKIIKFNYRHSAPQYAKREALNFAQLLRSALSEDITKKEVKLLGPAPRFIFQEKGYYNWHIILKVKNENTADALGNRTDIASRIKEKIRNIIPENWEADVNPENLM